MAAIQHGNEETALSFNKEMTLYATDYHQGVMAVAACALALKCNDETFLETALKQVGEEGKQQKAMLKYVQSVLMERKGRDKDAKKAKEYAVKLYPMVESMFSSMKL